MLLNFQTVSIVLATFIPTGLSIKCFQCSSAEDPKCADIQANDTSSAFLKECKGVYNGHTPFCRKLVTLVLEGENKRITRTCGWLTEKDETRADSCTKKDSDFIFKTSCNCFSDNCNHSTHLKVTFSVFLMCLFISLSKYIGCT